MHDNAGRRIDSHGRLANPHTRDFAQRLGLEVINPIRSPSRGGESRAGGAAPPHADPPVLGVLGLAAPPPVAQTALEEGTLPGIMRGGGLGCQTQT
jgi:hypothetical protein